MIVHSESTTHVPSSDSVTHVLDMSQTQQSSQMQSSQMDPTQAGIMQQIVNEPHFAGSQSILDPHIIQSTPRMNMNFAPQQMLSLSQTMPQSPLSHHVNPSPHPQFPVQQGTCMTDLDVLRVATQLKTLLKDVIDELVEQRVKIEVDPLKKELAFVKSSLAALQNEVKEVSLQNDELEQYSRRSCLRVSGIAETENENVKEVVLDMASRFGVGIIPQDIDRAHRIGKPRPPVQGSNGSVHKKQNNSREIIIKFTNSAARLNMLKSRATLRNQNARVYINEDLTQKRKSLAYECRQLKTKKSINNTWVYNGKVYVEDKFNKRILISSLEDLNQFK